MLKPYSAKNACFICLITVLINLSSLLFFNPLRENFSGISDSWPSYCFYVLWGLWTASFLCCFCCRYLYKTGLEDKRWMCLLVWLLYLASVLIPYTHENCRILDELHIWSGCAATALLAGIYVWILSKTWPLSSCRQAIWFLFIFLFCVMLMLYAGQVSGLSELLFSLLEICSQTVLNIKK